MRAVLVAVLALVGAAADPEVNIRGVGQVAGKTVTEDGVDIDQFFGIEYATAGRWESPTAPSGWEGVRDATKPGPSCPGPLHGSCLAPGESEACLFLNIHAPASCSRKHRNLPVVLWFHPGGFNTGCGHTWPGQSIVARSGGKVIVVTVNYRMNVFGFLGSESLRAADGSTGNFGLQDMRMALQWVRENIKWFGGSKHRITLMGQSSGAAAIGALLASPFTKKQFASAVAQSGLGAPWGSTDLATAEPMFADLLAQSNCPDVACLRSMSMEELLVAKGKMASSSWAPVVDGVELLKHPYEHFAEGTYQQDIPIMVGSVREEMSYFIGGIDFNEQVFNGFMSRYVKNPAEDLPTVRELYSPEVHTYPEDLGGKSIWWWMAQRAASDAVFKCAVRRAVRSVAGHGTQVYPYMAVHASQTVSQMRGGDGPGQVVTPHNGDLPYAWNCVSVWYTNDEPCASFASQDETDLAHKFSGQLVNFVTNGIPMDSWSSPYVNSDDNTFIIDTEAPTGEGSRYENGILPECEFWDSQRTA